jgi:hypothetical protein
MLNVTDYGMYPGTPDSPGMQIRFDAGLTLIMGANGLGKTTLVTLLYRLCTGPYEIAGLTGSPTLGTRSITPSRLPRWEQRLFAARVVDEAENASASLAFQLGDDQLEVTRSLRTLAVTKLMINGEPAQSSDDRFQQAIVDLARVPTFGDWILILRFLVFYFEDRRALVWDPTAQRQILRLLLLPEDIAGAWAESERRVLELDSRVRNLQNALNREELVEKQARAKVAAGRDVAEQLEEIEKSLQVEVAQLAETSEVLPAAEAERQRARVRVLTLEQEFDAARRSLERLELDRISSAFPGQDDTAKYLISRLMSTDTCQTCGNHVPGVAASLREAMNMARCVICDSPLQKERSSRQLRAQLLERTVRLEALESALSTAREVRDNAEAQYDQALAEFANLDITVTQRREAIAALVRRLPPDERTLHEQAAEVSSLRGRLDRLRADLDKIRMEFEQLVRKDMKSIAQYRAAVIESFEQFAHGFLFEASQLRWAPHKSKVGQTGPTVDFPAFEVEMSGTDFPSPVRRSGPDQVSESQREFVDLAFRMALMSVAGEGAAGSLVIDAPETSLDAVFSERAAAVLVRFADPVGLNRLIITSNLVDGQLIPQLLAEAGIRTPEDARFVDLLEIATPTAAIRHLASEYRRVRDNLFAAEAEA